MTAAMLSRGGRDSKVDSRAKYTPVLFDVVVSQTLSLTVLPGSYVSSWTGTEFERE